DVDGGRVGDVVGTALWPPAARALCGPGDAAPLGADAAHAVTRDVVGSLSLSRARSDLLCRGAFAGSAAQALGGAVDGPRVGAVNCHLCGLHDRVERTRMACVEVERDRRGGRAGL